MKEIKPAAHVTSTDVAKVLGVENEYREALFEQELKRNYDILMSEEVQDTQKNKCMNNSIINE